jgi:hypothetical protein
MLAKLGERKKEIGHIPKKREHLGKEIASRLLILLLLLLLFLYTFS